MAELDSLLDGLDQEVDNQLNGLEQQVDDQIQQQLDKAVAGVKAGLPGGSVVQPAIPVTPTASALVGDGGQVRTVPGKTAGASPQERSRVHQQEEHAFFLPRKEELEESWKMVLNGQFIQNNSTYAKIIGNVEFKPELENPTFNAQASKNPNHQITIFGGIARGYRLIAAGLALHMQLRKGGGTPSHLLKLYQVLGKMIVDEKGLDEQDVEEVVEECFWEEYLAATESGNERFYREAKKLRTGMEMSVIAHEAGHIALSHLEMDTLSFENSQNQERQADTFAADVLNHHSLGEHGFLGHVFSDIIFCWIDHARAIREPTTHPASTERFEDSFKYMTQFATDVATQYDLTHDVLKEFLPPTGEA